MRARRFERVRSAPGDAATAVPTLRLAPGHRRFAYAAIAAIWLSGVLWLVYHYGLQREGSFGLEPHPLEAWWLRLHGLAAFVSLFAFGLLWGVHIRAGLAFARRRLSGLLLLVLLVVLSLSGYLLYYAGEEMLRDAVRVAHWVIGLALLPPFVVHVMRARKQRGARGD